MTRLEEQMAKDPAVLFYTSDFISGTLTMTDEQRGKYIMLLCLQHQKHTLTEKDMYLICKTYDEDIFSKFIKDEQGNYYNVRMREESEKRQRYSESRANNRKSLKNQDNGKDMSNISKTYEEHMENENINENINRNGVEKTKKEMQLFRHSEFYDFQKFKEHFYSNPDYQKYDAKYYYESALNWSEANNKKKANWIATVYNWCRKDVTEGKPHLFKPESVKLK